MIGASVASSDEPARFGDRRTGERRGRPRRTEDGSQFSTRLPAKLHDEIIQLAMQEGLKVPQLVRQELERAVRARLKRA